MQSNAYIIGGAQTDFERNWTKEGKSFEALIRENIEEALVETGLTESEIISLNKRNKIAFFVGNFSADNYVRQSHLGALLTEISPAFFGIPSARYEAACASGSVAIDAAITKLRLEEYDVAIVLGWEIMKSVDSKSGGDILGMAANYQKEAKNIEFPFPKLFSKLADEIIHRNSKNSDRILDSLALISAINYKNAKNNRLAQTRKWYMSEEQAKRRGTKYNPYISPRLANSDCSQVTDGATTVVIVNDNYLNKTHRPSKIKGWGHRVAPFTLAAKLDYSKDYEHILPFTKMAIDETYARAKLTVNDIDVFETHDCFTSSEYVALSSFGLAKPGEEFRIIENGLISFEGAKPVNPSGGLIGAGHPVGASGVRMLLDLHKQVTNQANNYQVKNVDNGMMLNLGGSATTNYSFIVGKL